MSKTDKTNKTKPRRRRAGMNRRNVVSFRLTDAQVEKLEANFKATPATNINSTNQLCRKFVCDVLAKRCNYVLAADREKDCEVVPG